jgi:signal transduction histidine kinase
MLRRVLRLGAGLSGRLLALTIAFVMIAEVFVYAPSIARFRENYLNERVAAAHLATLALEATPDRMVSEALAGELLDHVKAHAIAIQRPGDVRRLLTRASVPMVDDTYDLRESSFVDLISDALMVLFHDQARVIRVISVSPRMPEINVEVVFDEGPMRAAMVAFSWRVLALSLVISLVTAGLVFVALQLVMVRPLRRLAANMVAFRGSPEAADRVIGTSARGDEIGVVQRELSAMEAAIRSALVSKNRLAALGTAVAKINHDLRNILTTVQLLSDRIARSSDPDVARTAPTLLATVDRAIALCSRTLDFAREEQPVPRRERLRLADLVEEVGGVVALLAQGRAQIEHAVPPDLIVDLDREQIFRALVNLARNAAEAGAHLVRIETADAPPGDLALIVVDDGPGLPPRARENLFRPFTGSARAGGTGLGLTIARELVRVHGGELSLADTSAKGTAFRIEIPGAVVGGASARVASRQTAPISQT